MYCANCGAQLGDGAAFCPMCGTPTQPMTTQPAPAQAAQGPVPPDGVAYPGAGQTGTTTPSAAPPAPDATPGAAANEQASGIPKAVRTIKRLLVILAVVCVAGMVGSIVGGLFATFVGDAVYGDDASSQSSYTDNAGYATADEASGALGDALETLFNATTTDELLAYGDAYLSLVPGSYADAILSSYDLTEDEACEFIVVSHWGDDDLDETLEDIMDIGWSDVSIELVAGEAMDSDELEELADDTGIEAEAGYHLGGTLTLTYDGERYEEDAAEYFDAYYLIEVDGAWYVW